MAEPEKHELDADPQTLRGVDAAQALAPQQEPSGLSADQRDALCVLGFSFIQHQQTEKALTLFEALRAVAPDDIHVERSLSYIYLTAQRYSEALETAERSAQDEAVNAPALLIKSRALWGLERADEARQSLQKYMDVTKLDSLA